jgi:hypothetical protein
MPSGSSSVPWGLGSGRKLASVSQGSAGSPCSVKFCLTPQFLASFFSFSFNKRFRCKAWAVQLFLAPCCLLSRWPQLLLGLHICSPGCSCRQPKPAALPRLSLSLILGQPGTGPGRVGPVLGKMPLTWGGKVAEPPERSPSSSREHAPSSTRSSQESPTLWHCCWTRGRQIRTRATPAGQAVSRGLPVPHPFR